MADDIFNQIETSAGTFPPGTYYNLLGFYSNMVIEPDALSADFIPITAVRKNTKLFAIGIIPPAVDISGQIINTSASTAVTDDVSDSSDGNAIAKEIADKLTADLDVLRDKAYADLAAIDERLLELRDIDLEPPTPSGVILIVESERARIIEVANAQAKVLKAASKEALAQAYVDAGVNPEVVSGSGGAGNWKGKGSLAAAKAHLDKLEGTDAKAAALGKVYLAAQNAMILEAQAALDAMKRIPPLQMLVNPQKFGIKGAKIVNDGNWGRVGPIIEHWGDDQDKISASGKLAGFYALMTAPPSAPAAPGQAATSESSGVPGLTRSARNFTKSWQNFQSLFLLYRNNAGLYLTDHLNSGEKTNNLAMLGSIYIYYDNILYTGSFDTLTLTENDTAPFSAEYSFEFTVRAAFTLDRTDDAFTYGAPNLFRANGPLSAADAAKLQASPSPPFVDAQTTFPEVGGYDPTNPTLPGLPGGGG